MLPFHVCSVNGIMQHVALGVGFLSLLTVPLRSIWVAVVPSRLLLFTAERDSIHVTVPELVNPLPSEKHPAHH